MARKPLLQAIAHSAGHPLRLQILRELNTGPASASKLSRKLKAPLSDVNYHLGVLVDPCGLIERIGSRASKGPAERFYELSDIDVDDLVLGMKPIFEGLQFEPFRTLFQALFKANLGSSATDETAVTAAEVLVDERGIEEIGETLLWAIERTRSIAADSQQRSPETGQSLSTATVGAVLFHSKPRD